MKNIDAIKKILDEFEHDKSKWYLAVLVLLMFNNNLDEELKNKITEIIDKGE